MQCVHVMRVFSDSPFLLSTEVLLWHSFSFPPVHDGWFILTESLWFQLLADISSVLWLTWEGKFSSLLLSALNGLLPWCEGRQMPTYFFPRLLCLNAFNVVSLYLLYTSSKAHCKEHLSDACVAAWFSNKSKKVHFIYRPLHLNQSCKCSGSSL